MHLALIAFAFALPLTALIWQAGHLRRRMLWHTNQTEARREAHLAASKRWEDAMAIGNESTRALKADFEKLQSEFNLIKARWESGRTEIKRAG